MPGRTTVERHVSYFEVEVKSLQPSGREQAKLTRTISEQSRGLVYSDDVLRYGILREQEGGHVAMIMPVTADGGTGFIVSAPMTEGELASALESIVDTFRETGFIPGTLFEITANVRLTGPRKRS